MRKKTSKTNCYASPVAFRNTGGLFGPSAPFLKHTGRIDAVPSLFLFMETTIEQLNVMGRIRTRESYTSALNSFRRYRNGVDLPLCEVTSAEMQHYEAYMLCRGICPNTTSFYMRILRAVYNRAVDIGLVEQRYPFRQVYTGVSKTAKRAISMADIKRIKQIDLSKDSSMELARDLFLFSFYTRGMAFVDIAYLRKTDIRGNVIVYCRKKTRQQLFVKVEKCTREIIDRYSRNRSPYVFPIIKTEGSEYRQYRNGLRLVNARLREIGRMLYIPIRLTSYVSRHSWGSAAKMSNIPISVISESMGHDNETTTRIYLSSLDTSVIDEANARILENL